MAGRNRPASGLPDRLRRQLARSRLLEPGDAVAVALSGGLDSVVLLHLLRFPLRDLDLRLSAVHVDHAMRPGSEADAAWVRGLCRAWDVPLASERAAAAPRSEAEARRLRYDVLERRAPPGAAIATAHHRDDQAETVLFRMARGAGTRGLRGIAPRRGRVVRPLLPFPRRALEAYAAAAGLAWREDPTNRSLDYARNRIRHRVLPALEAVRPGAARRLARLARDARAEEAAWDATLDRLEGELVAEERDGAVTLARPLLRSYHPHVQARLVRRFLRRSGTTPGRAGTQAALEFISSGPSGGQIHLPGGARLERDFDRIRIARAPTAPDDEPLDEPLVISGPGPGEGTARIGGRAWRVTWGSAPPAGAPGTSGEAPAERAVVPSPVFPLRLRGRRPGDRIGLAYGRKTLKKLMSERRLDRRARRWTPVLEDGDGRVLWVVGVARADGVAGNGDGLEIAVADAE